MWFKEAYISSISEENSSMSSKSGFRLIILSIESSFIPIVDVIFEHRLYLPSVGFFIALVTLAVWAIDKIGATRPIVGKVAALSLGLIVIALGVGTFRRNAIWLSNEVLWHDVVVKSPRNGRAHYNLGIAYDKQRRFSEAAIEYQEVINLDVKLKDSDAHSKLAMSYTNMQRYEDAIREYKVALRIKPDAADVCCNLGIDYAQLGNFDLAIESLAHSVRLSPANEMYRNNLAFALWKQGRLEEAVHEYQTVLMYNPNDATALTALQEIRYKKSVN